jgi:hypothetical protein
MKLWTDSLTARPSLRAPATPATGVPSTTTSISQTFASNIVRGAGLHDREDFDIELVILAWEELSATVQADTSWNQICQMVGFGSKKGRDLRERRRHDIESTGWRLVTGPNTGIGHTSAIFIIESQLLYIIKSIKEVLDANKQAIEVKASAEEKYTTMIHEEMKQTVWKSGGCKSWYQSKSGHVIAMFPGFSFTFRNMANSFKANDHIIS